MYAKEESSTSPTSKRICSSSLPTSSFQRFTVAVSMMLLAEK